VPADWELHGPERAGFTWRVDGSAEVVATPALMRVAAQLPTEGEAVGALLATESRFRTQWLDLEAARLRDLGMREAVPSLCEAIDAVGLAAAALRGRVADARLAPTGHAALEQTLFGGPADQPIAALPLRRAIAVTAPHVEGGLGALAPALPAVHPKDLSVNWIPGRLLQPPATMIRDPGTAVLAGHVPACGDDRIGWVLGTPWVTLLAVLVFTAEAWAAERYGGVQLELPMEHVTAFGAPPRVAVVVTLADGREVLCGSLGELCLRALDALGMALVPPTRPAALDLALAPVLAELLRAGVWSWQPDARPRYSISDGFSVDCYRREGHRFIYRAGEQLSQTLRSVCVAWARARLGEPEGRP
jgi:hypothetical protein